MTTLSEQFRFATLFIVLQFFCFATRAEVPAVNQFNNVAVSGYDVVAYFTLGRALDGSDTYVTKYAGATWRFNSAAHRELFIAAPENYMPQYGGYCAYAVSQGATATTVPEAWSIVSGKLYLNYSLSVRKGWEADKFKYISQADANWPDVLK